MDRWQTISRLCHAVRNFADDERAAFLSQECQGDDGLRRDVESLLRYEKVGDEFLERPTTDIPPEFLSPRVPLSMLGRQLGPYEILSMLGAGGMGEVYKARDTRLKRLVAIKILPQEFKLNDDRRARFDREARAIASLNHPHICVLHDVGQQDGINYLVMEYVEGQTLKERLLETPLSISVAMKIGSEIADALVEAHRHGIVHRDVKPGNIMLAKGGAKLLDFGLARSFERQHSSPISDVTSEGVILGTPGYMSPEQVLGKPVDACTDVFSLGVVIYEMIARRMAFGGATVGEIVDAVLYRHPDPLSNLNAEVSPELEKLVTKCLNKEKEHRYQSATELWSDLVELTREAGTTWVRPRTVRRHNLPLELNTFVGREREISELSSVLGETRLLTLSGSGGSGKTRLALKLASGVVDKYADGVWLAELAPVSNPELLPQSVAATLDVHEEQGRPLVQRLLDYLQNKQLLLVLDNCEHLVQATAKLVEAVLTSCERVRILVTSRESLGIPGERVYRVPPLSFPDSGPVPLADASAYEAVRLFVDRARSVSPLQLDQHEADRVVEICRRLDGIPLALEMAAARLDVLSLDQIAERLTDRFRLLAGTRRESLPRQETLRSTIDWSHDLLSPVEQTLFRRLGVFAGSFDLEAVEAVCADNDLKSENILETLSRLVDKSMITITRTSLGVRYRLLETLSDYAKEKFHKTADERKTRNKHLEYFLAVAEKLGPEFSAEKSSNKLGSVVDRLELEHQNLLRALEWCSTGRGGSRAALRIAVALWGFWVIRCYHQLAKEQLLRALDRDRRRSPKPVLIEALNASGHFLALTGELDAARGALEESLRLSKETGDQLKIGTALRFLGLVAWRQGRYSEAETLQRQSLDIGRNHGFRILTAYSLNHLAALAFIRDEYDLAEAYWRESDALFREADCTLRLSTSLSNYSVLAYDRGDYAKAESLRLEALTMAKKAGRTDHVLSGFIALGTMCANNDYGRSRSLLEEALVIACDVGDKYAIAEAAIELGGISCKEGVYEKADQLAERGLALLRDVHQERSDRAAYGLLLMSQIACEQGFFERGFELCQRALQFEIPKRVRQDLVEQLGWVRMGQGDLANARSAFEESLALAKPPRVVGAGSHLGIGYLDLLDDRIAQARSQFEDSLLLYERAHNTTGMVNALLAAGDSYLLEDKSEQARVLYVRAMGLARDLGFKKGLARAIRSAGIIALRQQQPELAVRCFAAGNALLSAIHGKLPSFHSIGYEVGVTAAHSELGPDRFASLWKEGEISSENIDELVRKLQGSP